MWKHLGSVFCLLGLSSSGHAGVLVVAADGTGSFVDLQPAVDAAQDGDVLLVRSGTYNTFAIADRALTVAADAGATVLVQGAVRVRNLSAGRTVVLSGLRASGVGTTTPARHGLYMTSNAGSVRLQSCTFRGASAAPVWDAVGYAAGIATDCTDVAFEGCTLIGGAAAGGDGGVSLPESGAGLVATLSTVTLHVTALEGGSGIDLDTLGTTSAGWDGGHGGPGLAATNSSVYTFASDLRGGRGGNGAWYVPLYAAGGNGGDGARAVTSTVTFLDSTRAGGDGGWGWMVVTHQAFLDGNPGVAQSGSAFVDWAGVARRLQLTRIAREGASLTYTVLGQPGDLVSMAFASGAGFVSLPASEGPFLLARPTPPLAAKFLLLGSIPASGSLSGTSIVPELGTGVAAREIHVQALVLDVTGTRFLSGARTILELDSAY